MRRAVATIFAFTACGDSLPGPPDAPPPPDSNPAALVKVRYSTNAALEDGSGLSPAGRRVYFVSPNGTLALVTETDASGLAIARLPDGGAIVVRDGNTMSVYIGARGGDEIEVGTGPAAPALPELLTLHLKLFAEEGSPNRFLLHSTCQATQGGVLFTSPPPHSIDVSPAVGVATDFQFLDCASNATQDMLLTTVDFNNTPLGYRYYPSTVFNNSEDTISLDENDNYFTVASHVTVNNIPASIPNVNLSQQLWGRTFLTSTDEVFFNSFQSQVDGHVIADVPIPTPTGATLVTHVTEQSNTNQMVQHVVEWAPASSDTTISFGSIGIAPLVTPARMDYLDYKLRWDDTPTAVDDPSRPDTVMLTMFTDGGTGVNTINIVAPYTVDDMGAASVALPKLSELQTTIFSSRVFAPTLTKLRFGDHTGRQQLLLTGLGTFPIDGASGRVTYEAPQPFSVFPD